MNKQTLLGVVVGLIIGAAGILSFSEAFNRDTVQPHGHDTQTVSTGGHNDTMSKLKDLKGDEFDKAFIEEMIIHHQGAIDMARLIETNAKHEEIKTLGKAIISAQSSEIDMMQTWQSDWGYKETPASHMRHQ